MSIEYLDEEFRSDKEIALIAINQKVQSIEFVDKSLFEDYDFMNQVADHDGEFALYYASDDLKQDKDLVLKCVN